MKTIKHILSRYTAFLWALLKPLGAWGVFVIAGMDAAAVGLPMDAVVATYVYQNRSAFLLYVLMASAGTAVGSIVLYGIGYEGGEALLRKRISPERFDKLHRLFENHPFLGLMLPAMLPPPTPFKLFVLAAAISEMKFVKFLLAIFAGRFVRFLILAVLTIKYGPDVVRIVGTLVRDHVAWVLGGLAVAGILWVVRWGIKRKSKAFTAENAEKK